MTIAHNHIKERRGCLGHVTGNRVNDAVILSGIPVASATGMKSKNLVCEW
jgi:hypothetical protein